MRQTIACSLVATFAALAVLESAAYADEPSAADVGAARSLGQEGVKLADAGNCQEAVDRLSRAEKLFHAPTTLGRLGECQIQIGKVVDGTENLNRVVREQLAPNAPPAFVQAQERAKKVLADSKGKIAKLKIAVAAPPDAQVTVKIDGELVPSANLNMNRPTDPGEHTVEAMAPGYKRATAKVTLAEGGADSVALTLEIDPNAPKPEPTAAPSAGPTAAQPSQSPAPTAESPAAAPPNRIPAYVAFGVGGVGVVLGSVFGLMASSKKSDLDAACTAKICGADQQKTINDGKGFATVSTVGFVVGAVGLAVGTYLYLTAGPSSPAAKSASRRGVFAGVDHVGLVF
jgi:hypothetical protein